jgi:hypothetical protein
MRARSVLLPALIAFLVGASPAHAWTWPVKGPVLQQFSFGGDPYAAGHHRGIDIAGPFGARVAAPAAGSVSFAGTVPGGGKTVTIKTGDGYAVTLVHLGTIQTRRGVSVAEGEVVGTVGASGEAEHAEPYVHLGVRIDSKPEGYVDPLAFLPPREVVPPPEPPADIPGEKEPKGGKPTEKEHGQEPAQEPRAPTPTDAEPIAPAKLSIEKGGERPLVGSPRRRSRPHAEQSRRRAPAAASPRVQRTRAAAHRPHVRVEPTAVSAAGGANARRADTADTSSSLRAVLGAVVAVAVAVGAAATRRRRRHAEVPVTASEPSRPQPDVFALAAGVSCRSLQRHGPRGNARRARQRQRHASVRRSMPAHVSDRRH